MTVSVPLKAANEDVGANVTVTEQELAGRTVAPVHESALVWKTPPPTEIAAEVT